MAKRGKRASAKPVSSAVNRPVLSYRQFKDWPTEIFISEALLHLKETGEPETFEAFFRNAIPRDAKFRIIRDIEIDQRKRPGGDYAPCPMCTTNKFLRGSLVYLPEMQCVAVIGNCCADKDTAAEAAREYRARSQQTYQETLLLDRLPQVAAQLERLKGFRDAARDATALYRRFRRHAGRIQVQLRTVRKNHAGQLVLSEIIHSAEDEEESDYFGPAGFKGRGQSETQSREHNFGTMDGGIITINNYDPTAELEFAIRQLESLGETPSEEDIIEFICGLDIPKRRAAVAILEAAEKGTRKFLHRLGDFLSFFTPTNAHRLDAYGRSPHNAVPFEVEYGTVKGLPTLLFKFGKERCSLQMTDKCRAVQSLAQSQGLSTVEE